MMLHHQDLEFVLTEVQKSRRTLFEGSHYPATCTNQSRDVPELHFRESTGPATLVLKPRRTVKPELQRSRLRFARLSIISDAAGRQKEECHALTTASPWVVMGARSQTRPSCTLPVHANREAFQLESRIDRDDAIDLPVRVFVVLAGELFLGIKVDGGQRHVEVLFERDHDLHRWYQYVRYHAAIT